jgi:type IV pilus assembly protein PilO
MAIKNLRFDNLPRPVQVLIFTVLIGCMAFAYYWYYLKDRIKELNSLHVEIANLERSVEQKKSVNARHKQFKEEIAKSEEQLAIRQKMLPTDKETPAILRSIQQMAASGNLRIDKFIPQPMIPRKYYSDWPIQLELQGNYNGLGSFFEKIGQTRRIINVGNLSIKGIEKPTDPTQTLTAGCTATTFVFNDTPAKPPAIENKKEKKR